MCVGGGGSVFTPASGPLSRTMWSQVVRVLLGLIHNVSQVHAVNTAHCKISTKNPSSETFTSLKVCVCGLWWTYAGSVGVRTCPAAAETESSEEKVLVWP